MRFNQLVIRAMVVLLSAPMVLHMLTSTAISASVRMLHSETSAYATRLSLIESAECSIDASYYEVADDDTAGSVLSALLRATQRGIRVRLLVDGHVGSNIMPKALMQYLIEHGIQILERPVDVRYRLEIGRPRLHDKLLIVDRQHLVIGGRNLEEEYFGGGKRPYMDRDLYVAGAVAEHAASYFDQRWRDPKCGQPDLHREEASKVEKRQKHPQWNHMPRAQALQQVECWLASFGPGTWVAQNLDETSLEFEPLEIEDCQIRFVHDFVGMPKRTPGATAPEMRRLLQNAKRSIELQTPYLAISHDMRSLLLNASRRGVKIRILTNSILSTDQPAVHATFANQRRWMLRAGIEIHEHRGPNPIHAKSVVIDGYRVVMGSYNFDMLSEKRNSEVAIVIDDVALAQQVRQSMATHGVQSVAIQRGTLFRYEAKQGGVDRKTLAQCRWLRMASPFIKRYL